MSMRNWVKKQLFTYFRELYDTPSDYSGQAGKFVKVNTGETGLEFDTPAAGADEKTKASSDDATAGYLYAAGDTGKIRAGTGIVLTLMDAGGGVKYVKIDASGGAGALGADGTIPAGETETTVVFTGEAGNFNRAVVSSVGLNACQRAPQVKGYPYDDGSDLKVDVIIGSSYTEDIDVHVVLANE